MAPWCRRVHAIDWSRRRWVAYARSLGDLPQGSWSIPLGEYSNKSLDEIWSLPGYGETRVGQVLDVFARVVATIGGCPTDAPLDVRLLPRESGNSSAGRRACSGMSRPRHPDHPHGIPRAAARGWLRPTWDRRRPRWFAGRSGRRPGELLRQVGDDVGLTREGVGQIIARAAQALQVRWPEGRFLLDTGVCQVPNGL